MATIKNLLSNMIDRINDNSDEVNLLSEEIVDLRNDKVDKTGITLDKHTDGLIYLFVDGVPTGNGVEITGEVVEGDIVGNFDDDNNILMTGNIADGTYKLKYQNTNGVWVEYGTLTVKPLVNYTVTQNLTKVTSSNSATSVKEGQSFTTNISVASGYKLSSITVTMGGTNISSTSVSGTTINIANVTGNIVITAVAVEDVPNYTNLFVPSQATLNSRLNSSNAVTAHDGYVITNFFDMSGKVPFTADTKIYMKGATLNDDGKSRIFTYKTTGTTYTNSYSTINKNNCTITDEGNGVISISGIASSFTSDIKRAVMCLKVKDTALTTADLENIVITINEPI